ncbi:MAG: prepilin-type N-terminal cleavage/methylation domain-containing protein [Clostridium sp.]|nr:prepilin-type N-terminal cleavage/methylation domain-containing protein [Clostridium sp.]MCM1444386.1 prepilin-type N-terminal cleavage/methylation domain-containing protein [Candidatus Amulumruptor caecigallinarius]
MKKGFTLIELMGVIVILAILSIIVVVGIDKSISEGRQDLYEKQITAIELSAKEWIIDNPNLRPMDNDPLIITIQTLVDDGRIDSDITNPKTGEKFDLSTQIKITKVVNTYSAKVLD